MNKQSEKIQKEKDKLIIELFAKISIKIKKISDLLDEKIRIDRNKLLKDELKLEVIKLIPKIKVYWSTGYNNCLHKNAYKKPFFTINVYRQLLKSYSYNLKAHWRSRGYFKDGKKDIERWYTIELQL